MMTVEECRKILGKDYDKHPDEDIEKIRDFLYELAQIDLECFEEQQRKGQEKKDKEPS